jgi:phage shock protein C
MKKLYLSQKDKKIAGVCGGLAETYNIDPTLIRLAFVLTALATAVIPALVTYIVAWIIVPKQPTEM